MILLLNKEHRDHGFLNLLSGYPLDLLGETNFQRFFSFNVLWFFLSFFLSLRKRYCVLDLLIIKYHKLLCSVEVSVGLGLEARVSVLMQLFTYQ